MSKSVTLELDDETYSRFSRCAENDNVPVADFMLAALKRSLEKNEHVEDAELEEIVSNDDLMRSIQKGYEDAAAGRGRLVE